MRTRWIWMLAAALAILSPGGSAAQELSADLGQVRDSYAALRSRMDSAREVLGPGQVVDAGAQGAYFRKIVSAPASRWRGVTGSGVLPHFQSDPERYFTPAAGQPGFWTGPLDRPSVYIGASSPKAEFEAGLTWDRVYDRAGRPVFTDLASGTDGNDEAHRFVAADADGETVMVNALGRRAAEGAALVPDFAFRPFRRGAAGWGNPEVGSPDNVYLYPGEAFTMTLQISAAGAVRLDIRAESGGQGTGGGGGWRHHTWKGSEPGLREGGTLLVKRVNAIGQFRVVDGRRSGNEGHAVIPTAALAVGACWRRSASLAARDRRVPLAGRNAVAVAGADTAPVYASVFRLSGLEADGGECIDIVPSSGL
jgi:hypothetical protein